MSNPTLITFIAYFIVLLGIGLYFYWRSANIEDYLLGGRAMGSWVTALSAQASDMSGWLLMGLPGAIYLGGMPEAWIAIGLFIGTVLNWKLVSARLRVYTQKTNAITLPCFFEARFRDPTGLLRICSVIITLVFFAIYASSGLVASGLLFESTFGVAYHSAVIIGGLIIIAYTFLGGFLAVCWTDLLQGTLMVFAILIVPALTYHTLGVGEAIGRAMAAKDISARLIPHFDTLHILMIISAAAWGLGYFGQPHILVRFMSVKSVKKLGQSMTIAIIWVFLSLTGAVVVGLIAIAMFDNLKSGEGEHEKVFIYMIGILFNPWFAGILLAAIFSAIMSTIDSQLLVSSSALSQDFYHKTLRKQASGRQVVWVGRGCVIITSVIALIIALIFDGTVLEIVAFAWAGLGSAFGPVILFALYSRRTTWQSALAGMLTGTLVLILWKWLGLSSQMYEIVPGFLANCLTIFLVNRAVSPKDRRIIEEFEQVVKTVRSG